jgi:hypothetical protein
MFDGSWNIEKITLPAAANFEEATLQTFNDMERRCEPQSLFLHKIDMNTVFVYFLCLIVCNYFSLLLCNIIILRQPYYQIARGGGRDGGEKSRCGLCRRQRLKNIRSAGLRRRGAPAY